MDGHERVIAQQRVQAAAVKRRIREGGEGIRRTREQRKEEDAHSQHHGERPGHRRLRGARSEAPCRCRDVAAQHQDPQQDRSLQRSPQGRDLVDERCCDRGVASHIRNREVVAEQRYLHRGHGQHAAGRHGGDPCQRLAAARGLPQRSRGNERRSPAERADEADGHAERAQQRNHSRGTSKGQSSKKPSGASFGSGTRSSFAATYSLVCFTSMLSLEKK